MSNENHVVRRLPLRDLINRKAYEWFWWVEPTGVRIWFETSGHALYVNDRTDRLRILQIGRWSRYKRGISARLSKVASDYGVPDFVTLRPTDVVIDVGANIGEFSMYAMRQGARVIAIEPDRTTLDCLLENIAGSASTIVETGVWNFDGMLAFGSDPGDANGSFINAGVATLSLPVQRLDSVCRQLNVDRIRLLKADAEGGEPELLEGAKETLQITEFVSLDCGPERHGETTIEECQKTLCKAGFEIIRRQNTGRFNLVARNLKFGRLNSAAGAS